MVDFMKDGQVGDEVYERTYGNGIIQGIGSGKGFLPISVGFNGGTVRFSTEGALVNSQVPTLCFGHREVAERVYQGNPPERFEYPIYKKHLDDGEVVKFTSLRVREILVKGLRNTFEAGVFVHNSSPHTSPKWLDCEKPANKRLRFNGNPKWAMVSNTTPDEAVKRIVVAKLLANQYLWLAVKTEADTTAVTSSCTWMHAWEVEDE